MSTSPLPPDPYEALGVSRECDLDEVKKAHRKLVLKHHPDRIKDPALVEQGKIEFHKVQQAYELLIDPVRRDRYNDQVKLAQLRKERMMHQTSREPPARDSYSRSSYSTPQPSQSYNAPPRREPRESMPQQPRPTPQPMYEERVPNDSYFDIPKYDEPIPRGHARKAETHERRASAARPTEKSSPKPKANGHWDRPVSSGKGAGSVASTVFGFSAAKKATEAMKKKTQERESHARAEKKRDVEEHRNRDMKQNYSRYAPQVEDDYDSGTSESSSDEDEPVVQGRRNFGRDRSPSARDLGKDRSPARTPRPRSPVRKTTRDRSPIPRSIGRERSPSATLRHREEPKSRSQSHLTPDYTKRPTSPRPQKTTYFDVGHESPDEHHDAYPEKYRSSVDYINASRKTGNRPSVSRQNSDLDQYWTASAQLREHKRSGSDSDRQRSERPQPVHKPSSHRRSEPREYEPHRPGLNSHTSAPASNMRSMAQESIPTRSRQNSYDTRDPRSHRREMAEAMPPLNRSGSAPIPRSDSKRDNTAPLRSSGLKQTETNHDSGYGSGSAPHTPETGGESPPNERERERERPQERPVPKRESSKIYKVSRDGHKVTPTQPIVEEPFPPIKKYLSPEDFTGRPLEEEPRPRRNSRSRDEGSRSRRGERERERRPSMTRNDTDREERPSRSKHSYRSPERQNSRTMPIDPNTVKFSTQRSAPPRFASYHEPAPSKHHSHRHGSESKAPGMRLFGMV